MYARRHTTRAPGRMRTSPLHQREWRLYAPAADAELLHRTRSQPHQLIVYDIFSPPQAAGHMRTRPSPLTERSGTMTPPIGRAPASSRADAVPAPQPDSEYYLPLAGVTCVHDGGQGAHVITQKRMDSLRTAMRAIAGWASRRRCSSVPIAYGENWRSTS